MLISYNRPTDITWSLIGTGAAWLSSDNGDALTDGAPARASRLQWLSGAQTTASVLTLRGAWAAAFVPRVVALLGLSMPVGTKIELSFRRPADESYTYLDRVPVQRVVELPGGSRCAWFVLDAALDPVIGVMVHIVNDVFGAPAIAAGAAVDIGEVWIGGADEWCLRRTMVDKLIDPTVRRRSLGSQAFSTPRLPYRSLSLEITPTRDTSMHAVRALRGACAQAVPVAVIPVETQVYDTACFGTVTSFPLSAMPQGKFWTASIGVDETPSSVA